MCVPEARSAEVLQTLHQRGVADSAIIGRILEKSAGRIFLVKQ
jgi:hydrogenase maturation factor